jgi:hypothetical protein
MSVPSLVPSIPTTIQLATPFSYTISNSTTIPAGNNVYAPPPYTLNSGLSTTLTTTSDTDWNTGSGLQTTWNTTFTVPQTNTTFTNLSFYNTSYSLGGQGSNGALIEFALPIVTNPYILDQYTSEITFGDVRIRLRKSTETTSNAGVYSYVYYYDVRGPVTIDGHDYRYNPNSEYSGRMVSFVLGTSTISYSFPNYSGSGTNGSFTNSTSTFSLAFNNIIFDPVGYPDLTNSTIFNNITNDIITYKSKVYKCKQNIPTTSPPAYFGVAKFYAPLGYNDYEYWFPVGELLEWDTNVYYVVGERVIFEQTIYKAFADSRSQNPLNNTSYWVLSDLNYPEWDSSSSTSYGRGDRVNYNGQAFQAVVNISSGNYLAVPLGIADVYWQDITNAIPIKPTSLRFLVRLPQKFEPHPEMFPTLSLSSATSSELIPFITGNDSLALTFSSVSGFQSVPSSPLQLVINQSIYGFLRQTTTYPITIPPLTIITTPTLTSPLSLLTYEPFSYTYSIPDTLVNVGLRYNSNTTSTSLVPYISDGNSIYEMLFRSTFGLTTPGTSRIVIEGLLNGNVVATSDTSIITIPADIISTPSITTGTLSLYKYESFSYVFTVDPSVVGTSFQVTRSSSELQTFLRISEDPQNVVFSGSFLISYSSPLTLIIDLMVGTTIISTQTILVSVGPGRFFPPTANQNFQLYQYENISNTFGSNPAFLTVAPMTSILSVPSLPSGLTFGGSCNTFFLQGTPSLQVNQSNYQVIGSNSSNGRIVTSIISIRVNPQQVLITPSVSTILGLTVDMFISPITLTAIQPVTNLSNTFRYTWSALPDGLVFQDINGSNVSQPFTPEDGALTITLAGAPSLAFANTMSTYSSNLFQTRLTGTQTDQTTKQTIGTSLFNFSLAETVLIDVSNSVPLYKSKPLGTEDVLITARSYFPTSVVSTPTFDALPPGLSLVPTSLNYVWRLAGTPTEVNLTGSYTFTAINANGGGGSTVATIPVNSNVVTFGGSTPANGSIIRFIVSRPLTNGKSGYYTSPIIFSATSTANATPITYTSSIDLSVYALELNSSSGALTGIPVSTLSSTTVTITATDSLGTTGTTTIQLSILADTFSWNSYTPVYFQNKAITPFQFVATSTLSERLIQSYSSTDLPTGMSISAGGLLTGTPTVFPQNGNGSFTITATTGYTTLSQSYTYSMIADQMLIVQANSSDVIQKVFTNIAFRTILYSSDTFVNSTYSIYTSSLPPSGTISITSDGLLSGNLTNAVANTNYTVAILANFGVVNAATDLVLRFSDISGSGSGVVYIPTENTNLTFIEPTQTSFTLFEYVPYSFTFRTSGPFNPDSERASPLVYFYTNNIPNGFQILKTIESDVTKNTLVLSGISPTLDTQTITVYAQSYTYPTSITISLRTITPFFINPQLGAGAYTAILKNDVLGNAAQNARDNRTFPEVNPLAGPLMAPRALDVTTPNDCLLKLCKKPCPTCHTMM